MDNDQSAVKELLTCWINDKIYEQVVKSLEGKVCENKEPLASDCITWSPDTETVFPFQFEYEIEQNEYEKRHMQKLIAKVIPHELYGIGRDIIEQCFIREAAISFHVLESMVDSLHRQNHEMVTIPKYHFHGIHNQDYEVLSIYEDVRAKYFTAYDYRTPLTFETASLVIKQYATVHAGYAIMKKRNCKTLSTIHDEPGSVMLNFTVNIYSQLLKAHASLLESVEGYESTSSWIKGITLKTLVSYRNTYKTDPKFHTLSLSCLMGNLLHFRNNQTEVCLSGFGGARLSTPSFDINNLLFICLDSNVRRNRTADLISVYYDRYKEVLDNKIPVHFTLDELKNHVRDTTLVAWFAMLQIFPSFIGGSQFSLEISKFNEDNTVSYINHYKNSLRSLFEKDEIFRQRFLDAYSDLKYLVWNEN